MNMHRWAAALASVLCLSTIASAEQYATDGRLEQGDLNVEASKYSSWYDAYTLDLQAGQKVRFEVTGMSVFPYFYIYDSRGEKTYATSNAGTALTVDWEVPASDTYTILLTELYREETPYRLVVSIGEDASRSTDELNPVTSLGFEPDKPVRELE